MIETLDMKNNMLGKQFLERFSIDDDSDIFEVWFNWIKWAEIESQIGERLQDKVAFIESLMVCKKGREYYNKIANFVGLNKEDERPLSTNENTNSLQDTKTEPAGLQFFLLNNMN